MSLGNYKPALTGLLLFFTLAGCTSVNYIGKTLEPTDTIVTYYSEADIEQDYTVIGHALGYTQFFELAEIHVKLIKEAKLKGADAILINAPGKSEVMVSVGFALEENRIYASFLKFK